MSEHSEGTPPDTQGAEELPRLRRLAIDAWDELRRLHVLIQPGAVNRDRVDALLKRFDAEFPELQGETDD